MGGHVHLVRRGETLSIIARRHHSSVAALARHNGIRNVNLIHVGQRIAIPSTVRRPPAPRATPPASGGGTTRLAGGVLSLTATDVLNIKKTTQTEWVQWAGVAQAHGIIDTILNRTASGHWGTTVADVVNARNQFSDVNGPISRRQGRNAVAQLPASVISRRVHQVVDAWLAERAAGRGSIIGSHLNYANPHYSDATNLAWINLLDGPRLGSGRAIHHHGTTAGLQRYRPGRFRPSVGGGDAPAAAAPLPPAGAGRRIDGNAVAAANGVGVKSAAVRIGRLDPAMEVVIRTVAQVAARLELPRPVITSGNDSRHSRRSLHYADRGLDFRGNNITVAQGRAFAEAVRQGVGRGYDVAFEVFPNESNNHLHVEYDPD